MSQPVWKEVGTIGDVNYPEYDGGSVSIDTTGVYQPELEYVEPPSDDVEVDVARTLDWWQEEIPRAAPAAEETLMATQEKYQGWANWETWNVALWFANDYGLYQAVRAHPEKFTATNVKSFVKHHLPDGTPDFKGGRSYSKVDWEEVAADFNEMKRFS